MVHLKIFFRFLQKRHGIEIDPAEPCFRPKPPQNSGDAQPTNRRKSPWLHRFGEKARETRPRTPRAFLCFRPPLSEICGARLEYFDQEDHFLRITGKGNKTRLVPSEGGPSRPSTTTSPGRGQIWSRRKHPLTFFFRYVVGPSHPTAFVKS